MVNSVTTNVNSVNNPFAQFKTKQTDYRFATTKPYETDTFETEEVKERKLGKKIALSALGVGVGILFLMRGLPKNAYKTIDKWIEKLETKLYKQRKECNMGKMEEVYTFTANKLTSFMEKAKSVNNIVSMKDISFEKLMSKTKVTKKIHTKITDIYEYIGRRTVNNTYGKTKTKLYGLFQKFEDCDDRILFKNTNKNETKTINGVTKTIEEWLNEIEDKKTFIRRTWNSAFGQRARDARFSQMQEAVKDISDEVWDATLGNFQNFSKRDLYETFIAEEKLAGKKLKIMNETKQFKHAITRDIDDIYNSSTDVIRNITSFINPQDKASRELIRELRLKLSDYKKLAGPEEKSNRIKLHDEINGLLNSLSETIQKNKKTYNYDNNAINHMVEHINDIGKIMGEDGKGALQEILTIYKHLLPKEDYLKLKESVTKTARSINDAVTKETDSFFDMKRDLKLGSAPTDILSILAAVGAIGVGLKTAEDKDQQYSVLLKAGIPALGAIATSLYFSASLVSGGKAMLYGGISGLIISKIGSMLDDYRKKHFPLEPQNTSPALA